MLTTKKASELKIGDKLMGGAIITNITPIFNYHKMEYGYTVSLNNPNGTPHHTGYDYTSNANIIMENKMNEFYGDEDDIQSEYWANEEAKQEAQADDDWYE